MTRKILAAATLIMAIVALSGIRQSLAQDSPKPAETSEWGHPYRLDFVVTEIEDGKKINSRQYSTNLNAGDWNEIKIGTRVPVEPKNGEFQYLDVGTNISCRLQDRKNLPWLANDVSLNIRSEISNFAVPDPQGQGTRPIIRQMKIDASTVATIGKSMVVGSVDDPNSKRQFQLEVTVTKLK